jgi:hypothetical protein
MPTLSVPSSEAPMKMEQIVLAHKIWTPGKYPEESMQHLKHAERLKSRILKADSTNIIFTAINCKDCFLFSHS